MSPPEPDAVPDRTTVPGSAGTGAGSRGSAGGDPAGSAGTDAGSGSSAGAGGDPAGPVEESPAPSGGAAERREMALVALVCAAAGGLALLAAGRAWLRVAAPRRPPLPDVALILTGRDLEPLVPALGVVGLAGVVGLLATRRWGRVLVGALLALSGVAIAVRSLAHLGAPGDDRVRTLLADAGRAGDTTNAALSATAVPAWPVLAAVAGLLLALGGLAVVLRSRDWPTMSARYERSAPKQAKPTDAALWDALDAGADPTVERAG